MKKIVLGVDKLPKTNRLTLLLGTFDGVHLGHYELVKDAKFHSEGELGVLLFDKNPSTLLGNKSPRILTSLEDKIRIFSSYGFDYVFVLPLNEPLLHERKEEFIDHYLLPLSPSLLVVGEDYSFGLKAEGKALDLQARFATDIVPIMYKNGHKIGTQEIIASLEKGDIAKANEDLGRLYEIQGKVINGYQNGRKFGFPTANLSLSSPYVVPHSGVYKTITYVRGIPHKSLTNIGDNPTIGLLNHASIETYIDHFHGDIYGDTIYIDFLSFLREEKKFSTIDDLKKQLEIDKKSLSD